MPTEGSWKEVRSVALLGNVYNLLRNVYPLLGNLYPLLGNVYPNFPVCAG